MLLITPSYFVTISIIWISLSLSENWTPFLNWTSLKYDVSSWRNEFSNKKNYTLSHVILSCHTYTGTITFQQFVSTTCRRWFKGKQILKKDKVISWQSKVKLVTLKAISCRFYMEKYRSGKNDYVLQRIHIIK